MANSRNRSVPCLICGESKPAASCQIAGSLRPSVAEFIAARHAERWRLESYVCRSCLNRERHAHLLAQLEKERGTLSAVEAEVLRRAAEHTSITAHLEQQFQRKLTFGQRMADAVAEVGGSWPFVSGFIVALAGWIALNTVLLRAAAFDPYPYILLNLGLSCLAAIQAPIIMMSQKRGAARDRMEADEDYKINLKAELEIAALHEKVDHLLHVQWERMVEIQQTQIELLSELTSRRG